MAKKKIKKAVRKTPKKGAAKRSVKNTIRAITKNTSQKITPCLWFDDQVEEAVSFYISLFENSHIKKISRYGEESAKTARREKGSILTVTFTLNGQEFVILNGGPQFKFSEAISFMVSCDTQREIDTFWEKLSAGGEKGPCGWLKDKYGVSWQIVPASLAGMIQSKDPVRAEKVMKALLQMTKLDIQALKQAYRS